MSTNGLANAASPAGSPGGWEAPKIDAHVVILNNYIRAHHVAGYRELAKRVRKLTILLSVPMEPDRPWNAEWEDLDVRVQKNWMMTTRWKHSTGFREDNFIHIPLDTIRQLRSLRPDIVFSYEMGMRTLFSSWYCRWRRHVSLVMVGNMSEHIERERGPIRRLVRWLVRHGVDYMTYNGPSCKRYLKSLTIPDDKLFYLPYCIDEKSVYRGPREARSDTATEPRKMIYCGAISQRKGIVQFADRLRAWCEKNPQRKIELSIAGSGPLQSKVEQSESENFKIVFLGNCDPQELKDAYRVAEICVFPSFADEWGLVPIEAMASGLPVLGSTYAQSVEAVVTDDVNGWVFQPTDDQSMDAAIDRAMNCSGADLNEMGKKASMAVADISATKTADRFCHIIEKVLPGRQETMKLGVEATK